MRVIGLTGGIASGKSTVSRILREMGAEIVDADVLAHEVLRPGTEGWAQVVATFGNDILRPDGTINRRLLGKKVFPDPEAVRKLNGIVHPRVIRASVERIESARRIWGTSQHLLVIDAPLLIEAGMHTMVDEVWVVKVDEHTQLERLMQRDKFTIGEAIARVHAQMPLSEKLTYADRVIDNTGSVESTRSQIERIWRDIFPAE
ncbi:MAG: dephospho-CoA kinase [Chloroflexota bacterium]